MYLTCSPLHQHPHTSSRTDRHMHSPILVDHHILQQLPSTCQKMGEMPVKSWSSMTDSEKLGLIAAIIVVIGDAVALLALLVDSDDDS